jgi:NAD(P)-dependent dehydrogenase (short-subunit alcohol dehydrogenase family)
MTTITHLRPQPATAAEPLLAGRVAIVTGASRGIGAAIARALSQAGSAVVLAARDGGAAVGVARDIRQAGGAAVAVAADVSDPGAVRRLVAAALEAFGRLDVAVNNAGTAHLPQPLSDLPLDEYDRVVQTDLRGVFLAMKYEIPHMLEAGRGAIVNIASTAGLAGAPGMSAYAAAKHGVIGLTRAAALDYAEQGIRVNALAPGPVLTDRLAAAGEDVQRQVAGHMPMRRLGRPEEIAAAAVWLASDQASFLTGATLPIDGGKLAGAA